MRYFYIILFCSNLFYLNSGCQSCSNSGRRSKKAELLGEKTQSNKNDIQKLNQRPSENLESPIAKSPKMSSAVNSDIDGGNSISKLFPILEQAVFMVYSGNEDEGAQGSGFFISDRGIGVTNYHVLEGHDQHIIKLSNGNVYEILDILEYDADSDYIIFQVEGNHLPFLKIASKSPSVGDDVFAIGSPKGLENSLTKGSISQFRTIDQTRYFQIDATIDHGSSGGALFNMDGEVIGVTSGGLEGSNLNFAIDISELPYERYLNRLPKTEIIK